ncbi:hypothetical protein AAY473_009978 [Plecturocebus cupreus]
MKSETESGSVPQAGVQWHDLGNCNLCLLGSSHSSASASPVETRFYHFDQAGLELLTSGDPPALASQSVGITGISHHIRLFLYFLNKFAFTLWTCPEFILARHPRILCWGTQEPWPQAGGPSILYPGAVGRGPATSLILWRSCRLPIAAALAPARRQAAPGEQAGTPDQEGFPHHAAIHVVIQQMFLKQLLWARDFAAFWRCNHDQDTLNFWAWEFEMELGGQRGEQMTKAGNLREWKMP